MMFPCDSHFKSSPSSRKLIFATAALALVGASTTHAQSSRYLPSAVTRGGVSLGLESPSAPVSATVWLGLHSRDQLDIAVQQMYTQGSPTFHHWMTSADLARFAPTAGEIEAVKAELTAHGLSIVSVDPSNFSIKFTGQASDFEGAFHTQLGRYQVGPKTMRVALSEPQLTGGAAGLVSAVTGYEGAVMKSFIAVPHDLKTGRQLGIVPVSSVTPAGAIFSSNCLYPLTTVSLSGPGTTTATYTGFGYGADPNNTANGTIAPCGYSPQDVSNLYGLNSVYSAGFKGAGQTIVVVDAYGSPTITPDLSTFSSIYGLPAPTGSSFKVYRPTAFSATNSGWAGETTLDVEWAHAIAPAAGIALVEASTENDDDLQNCIMYAINHHLGDVISNSYGGPESQETAAAMNTWNTINELAASQGISVHYATGDEGDYAASIGYTDVSSPADSPYATAVGGTSVAFSPYGGPTINVGWGTNITELSPGSNMVDDPPVGYGFQFGGGGGLSNYFAKPAYQSALPGNGRHLPDVSAIADPYTGVEIIITSGSKQYFEVIGGTSLATPVFSGILALVDQYLGAPIGQAGPAIAAGSPLIIDVVGPYTGFNTSGSITDAKGTTNYSAVDLSQPLGGTTLFGAGLWNAGGGTFYNITFGTDSSLVVTAGWDPVTGYGTPSF